MLINIVKKTIFGITKSNLMKSIKIKTILHNIVLCVIKTIKLYGIF